MQPDNQFFEKYSWFGKETIKILFKQNILFSWSVHDPERVKERL